MKFGSVLLGAAVATALSLSSASATVRIVGDSGGQIGPYLEQLAALRHSGERVVIDGPCLSACTMILGVIPRDRICVNTSRSAGTSNTSRRHSRVVSNSIGNEGKSATSARRPFCSVRTNLGRGRSAV